MSTEESREAARKLGRMKTPAQQAARRANAAKAAAAARKTSDQIRCDCVVGPAELDAGKHRAHCPRWFWQWRRKRNERLRAEKEQR